MIFTYSGLVKGSMLSRGVGTAASLAKHIWKTLPTSFRWKSMKILRTRKESKQNVREERSRNTEEKLADRKSRAEEHKSPPPSNVNLRFPMVLNPEGKVALVIGGCSGVGLVTAAELLRNKVRRVVITGCDPVQGAIALSYLTKRVTMNVNSRPEYIKLDVTDRDQFEGVFQKVLFEHKRIDMLYSAGGIMDDSMWESEVDTNVYGLVRGVLLAFRYMGPRTVGLPPLEALVTDPRVSDGSPIVVNMAGIAALDPLVGAPVFSLTQSAAISLTRSLGAAYHLGRTGVRVTCLCVGLTPEDALLGGAAHLQEKLIDSEWSVATQREVTSMPIQQARVVAEAALYLTRHAPGGTVWTVEDSELSQVEFPHTRHICRKCISFKK